MPLGFPFLLVALAAASLLMSSCSPASDASSNASAAPPSQAVTSEPFGTTPEGEAVRLYTVTNANGLVMKVTNYGGIITELHVPDRDGQLEDVVLGFDSLEPYFEDSPYFGALIGRYGNRIAGGKFSLDGETYTLPTNNGPNTLHGGDVGFDKVVWDAAPFERDGEQGVVLTRTGPDGEQGFPGALDVTVTYTLTDDDELVFDYEATTDRATPVNLTQHSYFNLGGHDSGTVLDHELVINADAFTPVDETLIPTGEVRPVAGTPFDFRAPTAIGARIDADDEQIAYGPGYDHNFVLNGEAGEMKLAARVYEPTSGRVMEVRTTEPGLQFYSGNFLDGSLTGKGGVTYDRRSAIALETQHFPDSPNQPGFPSTILRPGETYTSRTVYAFSTRDR